MDEQGVFLNKFFSSFFYFFTTFSFCAEFSYCLPIGISADNRSLLYYVTQDNASIRMSKNFEFCLNCDNHQIEHLPLAVPFCLLPIQPVLLFGGQGFSYFDQGILKSKYFAFRSPGSIYTSVPFDHTMGIHWYSDNHGILSILKNNFYVIYDLCTDNGIMTVQIDNSMQKKHALFPFCFQGSIFYVLESSTGSKIAVYKNAESKILFEISGSKIVFFTFLNSSLNSSCGIFALYSSFNSSETMCCFSIYSFEYNHQTMSFRSEYLCMIQIPFNVLQILTNKNLFPWCLQPVQKTDGTYLINWIDRRFSFKKVI